MNTLEILTSHPLNRSSYMPLYLQLAKVISRNISNGKLPAGEKLPGELDIAKTLNISRMTVRLAMDDLLQKGYIYREQGKGTFIAHPQMQGIRGFSSFTEDMYSRGHVPFSCVLEILIHSPNSDEQKALRIHEGINVITIQRLRFVDDVPWLIQRTTLSSILFPNLEQEKLDGSLFQILRDRYQIHPAWTEARVSARIASEEEAELLLLPRGAAVMVVDGITFTDTFEVIESVQTIYRADQVSLYMGRQRFGLPI